MAERTDEQLKGLTAEFPRAAHERRETRRPHPRAFAACREASRRSKNMRHFDSQIIGGIVLHRGNIAR